MDPSECKKITSDSDEGALNVGTINIRFGKVVRTWDMSTNEPFARYLHCHKGETYSVEDSIQLALSFGNMF